MLKVCIIGCGKIADDHGLEIGRIPGAEIVGVCDREELMAEQFAERFSVEGWFDDPGAMLASCRPDVVHITTPPQSHYSLARQCLEAGVSVYVEKPFTVNFREAEELIRLAERKGLVLTVGHDLQFSHVAEELRETIQSGYLGGEPVHLESYYCYDLGNAKYARALLTDGDHWIRSLPGGLLQNIISHGIARLVEYLPDDDPEVYAHGFVSPALLSLGEGSLVDELRVILRDKSGRTAYFTFSAQMRPSYRMFRIFGPENGVQLDEDKQMLLRIRGREFKSYAEVFLPSLLFAGEHLRNFFRNLVRFFKADLHMKAGMKKLIERFYQAVETGGEPPIPYREILLTSRIMDSIVDQAILKEKESLQSGELVEARIVRRASEPLGSSRIVAGG